MAFSSKEGVLAFPDDNSSNESVLVMGGMKVGYPANHQTRFFVVPGGMDGPHVGIRICFPVRHDLNYVSFSDTQGKPLQERSITIKLKVGTFMSSGRNLTPEELARLPRRTTDKKETLSVMRFILRDNEKAHAENYGTPTICASPVDQAIFDDDAKIDGVMSLRDFCLQRTFEVIVSNYSSKLPEVNNQFRGLFSSRFETAYPYTNQYVASLINFRSFLLMNL